ncbi:SDR family NAD(P)-dependent oxidoreductase [Streptomyces sp. tea 10]|nr:SDR family NAD(P)-dependent oxidoreductase [Streptomyces sp. tea 10]
MPKIFLVTGSSRGPGREIVTAALAAGHRAMATGRDPRALEDLVAAHGDQVRTARPDVTDAEAADHVVSETIDAFGRLDVVVNSAGQGDRASLEDTSLEAFRRQIDTNFYGTVYLSRAAVPVLRRQGGGRERGYEQVGIPRNRADRALGPETASRGGRPLIQRSTVPTLDARQW